MQNACRIRMLLLCLLLVSLPPAMASTACAPWDLKTLFHTPDSRPAEGFDKAGVRALFFDGLPYRGKETRVFAWYAAPEVKKGGRVPGMVLVHGGGGTAFAEWVHLWAGRGYAAIAMDTCGCVPRGEYGNWERHEFGGPAGWGGFDQIEEPVADQWTYHAIADVILAHSLLRSMPEVDPERTGITGISWGGYLTCIAAGVDKRFKCAIPVYGCGFLGDNSAWVDGFANMGADRSGRWLRLWDPSVYLPAARMPMLWVTGTNDFAYPMDSLQKSYRLPKSPRTLCVRLRMPHAHGGAGENPGEILAFARTHLEHGVPLPQITQRGCDGRRAWARYQGRSPVVKAELNYTRDTGVWKDRLWESVPAEMDAESRTVSAVVPAGSTVHYFNLYDGDGLAVSSEHEEHAATP